MLSRSIRLCKQQWPWRHMTFTLAWSTAVCSCDLACWELYLASCILMSKVSIVIQTKNIQIKIYSSEHCLVLSLSNGSVTYDQIPIARYRSFYPQKTVAPFACDNGFTLHGVRSLTCVHSSSWYSYDTQQFNELPRCVLTGGTDLIQSH